MLLYTLQFALWGSFSFHCHGEGTSTITVSSSPSGTIYVGDGGPTSTVLISGTYKVTCNQYQQRASSGPRYVGGELFTANKLDILSPYLALVGISADVLASCLIFNR